MGIINVLNLFIVLTTLMSFCKAQLGDDDTESQVNIKDATEYHFGGDVRLTSSQESYLVVKHESEASPFGIQNAVLNPDLFDMWENGRVPYVLSSALPAQSVQAINDAIDDYHTLTCIRFVERTNEADYVNFIVDNGCYSYIGKVGGPQDISIGSGCGFKGIVIHEMFHALGRFHEQSRPDRDLYVTINRENIRSGFENNFDEADSRFVTTQGVDYDFGSIMHYSAFGFSSNRQPTIEPLPGTGVSLNDLGQRDGLSERDLLHARLLYCNGEVPLGQWNAWGSWSSCSRTCNGGVRSRTRTCSAEACEGQGSETETCNTASCPLPPSWGAWTAWSGCSRSCGGGTRNRQRVCLRGNTCQGVSTQSEDCNEDNCPQPTTWGPWGSWSTCSKTCATGEQRRRRVCQNGNSCDGIDFETRNCNENVACGPDPTSTQWSEWSACSKTCGTGVRSRTRNCQSDGEQCERDDEACNTEECPEPEPRLRGIVHIGCYYVPTFATPLKLLEGETPDLSDRPSTRLRPIQKCGEGATELSYDAFALATGFCISGSSDIRDYQTFQLDQFCRDGVGGYAFGYYFMDVYQLVDLQQFQDSAAGLTDDPSPSPSPSAFDGANLSLPSIVIVSLALLASVCLVLFS